MASTLPRILLKLRFEKAAEAYLAMLRTEHPEHFMESTSQARQRKITVESFDLVHVYRPDIQAFNELLLQYRVGEESEIRRVVPDNMIVVCDQVIDAEGSFDLPFQPVGPLLVLEYVSKGTERKDYEDNLIKYEQEVKVPYYLLFRPEPEELTLYHLNKQGKYVSVRPNDQGRFAIPELELEAGVLDGWARFWFRGELLPLPADLQRSLDEARQKILDATRRADELQRQKDEETRRADELQKLNDEAARRANDLQREKDEAARRAVDLQQQKDDLQRQNEELLRELARLRAAPPT